MKFVRFLPRFRHCILGVIIISKCNFTISRKTVRNVSPFLSSSSDDRLKIDPTFLVDRGEMSNDFRFGFWDTGVVAFGEFWRICAFR